MYVAQSHVSERVQANTLETLRMCSFGRVQCKRRTFARFPKVVQEWKYRQPNPL